MRYRPSKHKITIYFKSLGVPWPHWSPLVPLSSARWCKPVCLFQTKFANNSAEIGLHFCSTFDMTVQYSLKQVRWNNAEIHQYRWPKESQYQGYFAFIRVMNKCSSCSMCCYNTSFSLSFILASPCWPITSFHTQASFPRVHWISQGIVKLFIRNAFLVSSTNSGQCAGWVVHLNSESNKRSINFSLNIHTVQEELIKTTRQLGSYEYPRPMQPGRTSLAQCRRVTTHCPAP